MLETKTILTNTNKIFIKFIDQQVEFKNQTRAFTTLRFPQSSVIEVAHYSYRELNNLIFSNNMVFLDDNLKTHFEVFFVQPESCISEVLNEFILECHQHGFFSFFESKYFEKPQIDKRDPRTVLTFYMLSAGFYLWLISIALACVVFVAEHAVRYYTRTRHLGSRVEIWYELEYIEENYGKFDSSRIFTNINFYT